MFKLMGGSRGTRVTFKMMVGRLRARSMLKLGEGVERQKPCLSS